MIPRKKIINYLQWAIEVSLWLVIFFLPISIAATNIGIGFCILFWLFYKIISNNFKLPYTTINWLIGLYLLIYLVSLFNTNSFAISLNGIRKLFKYLFLFFPLVEIVNHPMRLKRIVIAGILGLALVSLDGVVQYFRGVDFLRGYSLHISVWKMFGNLSSPRIKASMHNPNSFACYLMTLIPLMMTLFLYYAKGIKRWLLVLIFILAFFCIFHTQSRGAALSFVVVMILISIIKKDKRLFVALIILILFLPILLPKPLLYWTLGHLNPYDFFIEEEGRRWHWQAAINMIKAHPFIGVGTNMFCTNYIHYKSSDDPMAGWFAHNSYLHIGAEVGLIGLGIFIFILGNLIRYWWRSFKALELEQKDLKAISLGIFGGFIGYLVAGLLESSLQISNLAVLFWFMAGLMVCVTKLANLKIYTNYASSF